MRERYFGLIAVRTRFLNALMTARSFPGAIWSDEIPFAAQVAGAQNKLHQFTHGDGQLRFVSHDPLKCHGFISFPISRATADAARPSSIFRARPLRGKIFRGRRRWPSTVVRTPERDDSRSPRC